MLKSTDTDIQEASTTLRGEPTSNIRVSSQPTLHYLTPSQIYDLWLLTVLALLLPGLLLIPPWLALLRVPFGLVLALLAPGYALAAAIFPGRHDIDGVARAALSFGLSAATIPVLALLLDKLPWGINPWPIAIALATWILLCCGIALVRRMLIAADMAYIPPTVDMPAWWRGQSSRMRATYLVGIVLCATLLGGFAVTVLTPPAHPTEFYILGRAGLAEGYPRESKVGEEIAVTTGIVNEDSGERTYRLEIWAADALNSGRRALLVKHEQITLAPGQHLEQPIAWRMPWAGDDQQVELLLFNGDDSEPYRRLKLWMNVKDS
jgi:uncharacterized membrane protein